jgi:hypothetical protein
MRAYVAGILPSLRQYSHSLDTISLFTEQPWVVVDDEADERVVHVFRKGGDLLVSRNGDVQTHGWEHIPALNSIVIDWGKGKTMYNQGFLDDAVLVLKKDGVQEYLLLGNEAKLGGVTEADVLRSLRQRYLDRPEGVPSQFAGALPPGGTSHKGADSAERGGAVPVAPNYRPLSLGEAVFFVALMTGLVAALMALSLLG